MKPDLHDLRLSLGIAFLCAGCLVLPVLAQQPSNTARQPDRPLAAVPEGTKVLRDLEYARVGDKRLLLDLYLPENAEGPLPVIVGIHGGGWAAGSKDGAQGARLAARGYAVASISYRLSGEAIFPAQIEDCKAAVRWLRANAQKYHLNPDRIGAIGHSAGGHLTSLLATTGDVKEFDKGENPEFSSRIQAACPLSGPTDLLQMDAHAPPGARLKHDAPGSPEARLIGGPIQENKEKAAGANPITYLSKDDPPFLIIHGDQDATVPWHQAQLLYEALKRAGMSVQFHTVKGAGHGIGGREVDERIEAFFDRHLKAQPLPAGAPEAVTSESTAGVSAPSGPQPPSPPTAARRGPGIPWEVIVSRTDANKDGKISKDEFRGPPPLFDRLDRDGDDVLTKEEHDRAFPPAPDRKASSPQTTPAQRPPSERSAAARPAAWAEPDKSEPEDMKYGTFYSKAAGTEVSYLIYLPPDYETAQDKRYPVVYWLHGRGGSQTGASQLVRRLDPAIRAGKAAPMIVVGVNGLRTSSFVDSADGKSPVQTVIVKELIPHVDATYRAISSREGRAIEGFSMGGAGAAKIGFKYPELFGAVSILAGALHDLESYKSRGTAFQDIYGGKDEYFQANSPWNLVEENADAIRGKTTVRIVVGGKDNLLERNTTFHQLLDRLKIAHDFAVVKDAPHSPGPLYDGVGDQTWAFYRKAFVAVGKH